MYKMYKIFLLLLLVSSVVHGEYELLVRIHSYANPTNQCAACRQAGEPEFGCCDNHQVKNSSECSSPPGRMCELQISACLRQDMGRNGQCNSDGALVQSGLMFRAVGRQWEDTELLVVLVDEDAGEIPPTELVDTVTVELSVNTIIRQRTLNGDYGLASVELSVSLVCTNGTFPPNCTPNNPVVGAVAGGVVGGLLLLVVIASVIVIAAVLFARTRKTGESAIHSADGNIYMENQGFTDKDGGLNNPVYSDYTTEIDEKPQA